MIRRFLNLSVQDRFAEGIFATPASYTNPWAKCWGSSAPSACAQVQMQAEAPSMHRQQMQAGSMDGEPCLEPDTAPAPTRADGLVRILPIINNKGLHARASAKFVQTAEGFDADVRVTRCGETVGGQSIMGLMMLAAARGTTIVVETSGAQATACMDALEALLADKFGEEA
jgi:phosphocarrier protein HPr